MCSIYRDIIGVVAAQRERDKGCFVRAHFQNETATADLIDDKRRSREHPGLG
jgi:hypothetical protein